MALRLRSSQSNQVHNLCLAGTLALLATLYWLGTWWGIGVRPDSVTYLGMSKVTDPQAPGYTALIQIVSSAGMAPTTTAWWLNLSILFANTFLIWLCLRSAMRSVFGATVALLAVTLLPIFLYVHVTALSDPLFFALFLSTVLLLARYGESGSVSMAALAGLATGLALLTRFAAAPIVVAGAIFILLYAPTTISRRILHCATFGVLAAVIYLGTMSIAGGSGAAGTGREFALLGDPGWLTFKNGFDSISSFFMPVAVPVVVRSAVVIGFTGIVTYAGVVYALRSQGRSRGALIPQIMLIFAACYAVFLLVSVFVEANLPFQPRYLAPLYIASVISLAITLNGRASPPKLERLAVAFGCLAAILVAGNLARSIKMTADHVVEGNFYASPKWFNSPTIAYVRSLRPDVEVYTNAPDAVGYLAGRPAKWVPKKFERRTGRSTAPFDREVANLKRAVENGKAVIVWFDAIDFRFYLPSESELKTLLGFGPTLRSGDGTIYARVQGT